MTERHLPPAEERRAEAAVIPTMPEKKRARFFKGGKTLAPPPGHHPASWKAETRSCGFCRKPFTPTRGAQRFGCTACRMAGHGRGSSEECRC